MNVEKRTSFYVKKLQEATVALGYSVLSKETLLAVVAQYVATYNPPQAPSESISVAGNSPFSQSHSVPPPPIPKQLPTNVVDIFSKKK